MSWDVLILSAEGTPDDLNSVPSGWMPTPMGDASLVRQQINSAISDIEWSIPRLGVYRHEDLYVEFGFQEAGEVEMFVLYVRGSGDPIPLISKLCLENDWVAIDCSDLRKIEFDKDAASGWKRFTDYRDFIIKKMGDESA